MDTGDGCVGTRGLDPFHLIGRGVLITVLRYSMEDMIWMSIQAPAVTDRYSGVCLYDVIRDVQSNAGSMPKLVTTTALRFFCVS